VSVPAAAPPAVAGIVRIVPHTKASYVLGADGRATAIALGGGVAANTRLREELLRACDADGRRAFLPSPSMCTDNAAMIAAAGWHRLRRDGPTPLDHGADPNLRLPVR